MGGSLIEVSIYMRDYIFFEDLDKIWSQFAVDLDRRPFVHFSEPANLDNRGATCSFDINPDKTICIWTFDTFGWSQLQFEYHCFRPPRKEKLQGKSSGITRVNLDSGGHYHPASSGDPRLPIWPPSLCIQTQDHGLEAGCLRFLKI